MSQEDNVQEFVVRLFVEDEIDCLEFNLGSSTHKLNLNLEDNQSDIKAMFCDLIPLVEGGSIKLLLRVDEGYDNILLKEVAAGYINDLNSEIEGVRTEILDNVAIPEEV